MPALILALRYDRIEFEHAVTAIVDLHNVPRIAALAMLAAALRGMES